MQWLIEHWRDNVIAVVLAIIFAAIFAVVADAMSIGSRIRESLRRLANRRAERSLASLKTRIGELEHRRKMLASRSAMLMLGLQSALITLALLSGGCIFAVLRMVDLPSLIRSGVAICMHLLHQPPERTSTATPLINSILRTEVTGVCLLFFGLATATAIAGLKLIQVDTEEKLAKAVAQLDQEIGGLKLKETALLSRDNNKEVA